MRAWTAGLLTTATLLTMAACQPVSTPMTPEEIRRVAQLAERMAPRCVGRYVIDLPEKFVLNSQSSAETEDVKIDVRPMTKSRFDLELADRKKVIEHERLDGEDTPSLTETRTLQDGSGLVFNRSRNGGSAALRTWELLSWRDGYRFSASIDARDMEKASRLNESDNRVTNVEEKFAVLMSTYNRLRGRAEGEIPRERGFCIANGFVAGPASEKEAAYVAFHLENSPDVYFHLSATPEDLKEQSRLLQRSAQVEREMKQSGTQTIRKGEVRIGGMAYDEWLMKGPTPDRVPGTMFNLLGNEASPGAANPFIRVELFNGFRIPARERTAEESAELKDLERATLSPAEAVAVWDKVVPTLRLRPGAL